MASRSLSVSRHAIVQIKDAVAKRGLTQKQLASEIGASRSSVIKFLSGQRVDRRIFIRCCNALEIDWEKVCDTDNPEIRNNPDSTTNVDNLDDLVKDIRKKVSADISARCGTMRILDMEQPIGIGDIYTSVNILEKLLGHRRLSVNELFKKAHLENSDRLALGQVCQRRVEGLEAVKQYSKLMVLGKPGAGKTTFLKRLAILCNQGRLQPSQVPIFIPLKEFAEIKTQPVLEEYIKQQWQRCGVEESNTTKQTLSRGRAMILLDGLDEVQEKDYQRILNDIKDFSFKFRGCQFVMTCRIAAQEYTFQQFTEVEITDFDDTQISKFATKWFSAKKSPQKGEVFLQRLEENRPIKELASNPLLLTLLCLVFGEAADFPSNRSELYKEGLDILLKKWDAQRNIDRYQIYKKLSLKRKEDLLSHLAFHTFERGDYFFKKSIIEQQIFNYIRNLSKPQDDEALDIDSTNILASMEAQHGILIERARGIYSFSHLTFQEYFVAKHFSRATTQLWEVLESLTAHTFEKRYREVFLLTVCLLPEADDLLTLMKKKIDRLFTGDEKLKKLLIWINQKAESEDVAYSKAAIRAFYYRFVCTYFLDIKENKPFNLTAHELAVNIDHTLNIDRLLELEPLLRLDLLLHQACNDAQTIVFDLDLDISVEFLDENDFSENLISKLNLILIEARDLIPELAIQIESLNTQLLNIPRNTDLKRWWKQEGKDWLQKFRDVIIKHRNIGHDWQFTDNQRDKIQEYYTANKLLIDCLNSDCYIASTTRQEIEETLLILPTSEIE